LTPKLSLATPPQNLQQTYQYANPANVFVQTATFVADSIRTALALSAPSSSSGSSWSCRLSAVSTDQGYVFHELPLQLHERPTNSQWIKKSLLTPVAGPIFETKIERFFWRDFSGEELLPENSFLGQ